MDNFYTAKAFKLGRLMSTLESAMAACGELERHEATAPAGEEGYMFDTFATLTELHASLSDELDAVRAMAVHERK